MVAAAFALPLTIALIFLMTRLILPGDQDRLVTRMIQDIEFLRTEPPPRQIEVFAIPPPPKPEPPPEAPLEEVEIRTPPEVYPGVEPAADIGPARLIDWLAEVRKLTEESDEESLQRWLLEQGYERYVSIMQGPLPITNSVRGSLPESQEERTGYLNTYGDLEFRISENCVMQTQVAGRFDASDYGRKLPMRVMCKQGAKQTYDFERD